MACVSQSSEKRSFAASGQTASRSAGSAGQRPRQGGKLARPASQIQVIRAHANPRCRRLTGGQTGGQVDREASRQLPGLQLQVHDPYKAALTSSTYTYASIRKNVHLSVSGKCVLPLRPEVLVASERACETASSRLGRSSSSASLWHSHEGRDSEHGGALGPRR